MKKRFRKNYYRFLIISFIIMFIIYTILWLFLYKFEAYQPKNIAISFVKEFNKKDYKTINKYLTYNKNEFVNKDSINEYLSKNINKKISFDKKIGEYQDNQPVYSITLSNEKIGVIYLKKQKKKGLFNLTKWEIDKITGFIPKRNDITIFTYGDHDLYLNNIKVDKSNIVDNNYLTEELKEVTKYINLDGLKKYEIKDVFVNNLSLEGYKYYQNENEYIFYNEDISLLNEEKYLLKEISEIYTRYVVNEIGFNNFSSYLINGSKTYNFMKDVAKTNIWSGNHSPTIFSNFEYINMHKYSSNAYSITIKYDYEFNVGNNKREFSSKIDLYMIKINNVWKVALLKIT